MRQLAFSKQRMNKAEHGSEKIQAKINGNEKTA
jgi:hypothetical protein